MDIKTLTGVFDSNTYIITTPKGTVVIDCGIEFGQLKKVLDKCSKPISVLITHGHFDHMYAAADLVDYGATVYIHSKDAERLESDKNSGKQLGYKVSNCTQYQTVQDGQVLELAGLQVQVVYTPGHTDGGVCYIVDNCIFTGDTLFYHDCGRTDLYGGNQDKLEQSLRKLFALDGSLVVYSGHERTTTIENEKIHFKKTYNFD